MSTLWAWMQIHWLRIILDEGHMLGTSLTMTNKLQMAISLRAERRWVMTGTRLAVLLSPVLYIGARRFITCLWRSGSTHLRG